jgi:hypothetical protein
VQGDSSCPCALSAFLRESECEINIHRKILSRGHWLSHSGGEQWLHSAVAAAWG